MNAYIKRIVLFSKDGDMREVPLDEGLNIITGDSKTGKSALIEIVDYCLFSSRSTIPVGKIATFTDLFCIVLKTAKKYLVIARPHAKSLNSRKAYFSFEGSDDFLRTFSLDYFSNQSFRPFKNVQQDVEQHLGLSVSDTRESSEDSRSGAGKVTMRSFISVLFQHQNLIANKHSLFYRFDDYQKKKKTIDQFPILLGWVDAEYYRLKQQLENKKQQLSKEQKRQKSIQLNKSEQIERLRVPIGQYYDSIGYVLDQNTTLPELKKIAANLPNIPKTAEEDSDIKLQLSKLKNKRAAIKNQLSEVNSLINQMDNNSTEALSYGSELSKIVSVSAVEIKEDKIECPVCHHQSTEVEALVETINTSRNDLILELQHIGHYKKDNSEHLTQLIEKQDLYKKDINIVTSEIINLERVDQNIFKNQSLRETLMLLRGRIEATLDQILFKPTLDRAPFDIKELEKEITDLEGDIRGYNLDAKIEDANSFISKNMTRISQKLDFEKELTPGEMRFDLKTFEFYYNYKRQNISLSEMGSGANWLACHLSLFLSLLHLSCKEEKSCIPSFLFIDQPSQVYFPKITSIIVKDEQADDKADEDELTFDENIEQVKNIFRVIIQEIENITEDCGFSPQIVVMEHADEKEFNQYVKKRWDNQGKKLI